MSTNISEISVFETLSKINVNTYVERRNGLAFLPWARSWQLVKSIYPEAVYTVHENAKGMFYHSDGRTAWVKVSVCIEGIEHTEYLPVMDMRNQSIPLEAVKSTDVNKAIQRALTKACARHGLGIALYAGEDLPEAAAPQLPPAQQIPPRNSTQSQQSARQQSWRQAQYPTNQ